MSKNCYDLKLCPASYYCECEAYRRGMSCWEIKEGCLCHAFPSCEDCLLYQKHLKDSGES